MADFKELIDSIRKEQVTLFLGSGFSRKAGAPMANAIVASLKESMPDDIKDDFRGETHLDLISEEYEQIYGRESLINKLEEIFNFMPTDTSDHTCLPKIPHIRHIITTNYDTLIEDAYGPENCYVVRTTADCVNLPKDKTIIYKIHGDFIAKDNIVLTKQDYTNFFSDNNEPLLWKYIQSHILTNDMLFIGYSLEDTNIYTLIQEIRKQVKTDTRKYFLIAPGLLKHKIERLARTEIKYFNAKAEDLFPVLFETLNKRIKFLNEVVSQLRLEDVETIHGRAEDYAKPSMKRESFDVCVSRAVANLASLSEYCLPYVKIGGYFIPYKSGKVDEELEKSKKAVFLLGGKIEEEVKFFLPDSDISRSLIKIKKVSVTPKKYPRKSGLATKEPIK